MTDRRCTATTRKGEPCKSPPRHGTSLCRTHTAAATGRPAKLTEDVEHKLVILTSAGNCRRVVAEAAGISAATLYRWLEHGKADDEHDRDTPLRELYLSVRRATAESEAIMLQRIDMAARGSEGRPGDWRAAAWLLERRYPERYGNRGKVEVQHSGQLRVEPPEIPDEAERLAAVAQLLKDIGCLPADADLDVLRDEEA